jgi:O-antigen/teichoic acid export membrane protein
MRTVLFCGLPVAILICTAADPFLKIWVGNEFAENSAIPLYILVMGGICCIMGYVPHSLLLGMGRTMTIARCHLIEIVPYFICTAFLTWNFGAVGAALAASLRMLFEAILFFGAARHETGLSLRILTRDSRIFGLALVTIVCAGVASRYIGSDPIVGMAISAMSCAMFCGLVWTIMLDPDERKTLLRSLLVLSGRKK